MPDLGLGIWSTDRQANGNNILDLGFLESEEVNIALSGIIRLGNAENVTWRNFANSADLTLTVNASDELVFNGGTIGGEVFTWTAGHSMATFKLTATAANNVILNPPTGQNVEIQVNAIQEYLFGATTADFNGNGLSGLGILSFSDTLTSIQKSGTNLQLDVATGGIFELRINNIVNYTFGAFALDMLSKRIDNISQMTMDTASIIRWGGTSTRAIFNDATGFIFKVPSADTFTLEIATVAEFRFSASALDVIGNDIDNIQNLIHDISTSGVDIDFNEDELQTISIAVNTTFTTVNLAAGRSKTLKITTDATLRTFTFPGWDWVSAIPADQAASKDGYLTLTSYGTTDADVVAAYQVGSL